MGLRVLNLTTVSKSACIGLKLVTQQSVDKVYSAQVLPLSGAFNEAPTSKIY